MAVPARTARTKAEGLNRILGVNTRDEIGDIIALDD